MAIYTTMSDAIDLFGCYTYTAPWDGTMELVR